MALGASHSHIERQLWVENLLLALAGGAAAIAVGFAALRGMLLLVPEHFLPVTDISLDNRVLVFTLFAALLTCVLFGMLPALAMRTLDLRSTMARRTAGDKLLLRKTMIAGEIALTLVLLAASGLLIRTLIHLQTLPPGFSPNNVMTAKVSLDDARYQDAAVLGSCSTAAPRPCVGFLE